MEIKKHAEKGLMVKDIVSAIEEIAPAGLQEKWDNSGLLIGFEKQPVNRIMTCLEINNEVLQEAKDLRADMVVTHHPLIFEGMKSLYDGDYKGNLIMKIINAGISVYSCHTPFDKVKGGNNDIIADKLGLSQVKNLNGDDVASSAKMIQNNDEADIGRIGVFKTTVTLKEIIDLVSGELEQSIRQLRVVGDFNTEINKVGLCTGAGADLMEMAVDSGCQLFITGDVKYHEARKAQELGICLLDAGHYGTEKFFGKTMEYKLRKKLEDKIEIFASKTDIDPFEIL